MVEEIREENIDKGDLQENCNRNWRFLCFDSGWTVQVCSKRGKLRKIEREI